MQRREILKWSNTKGKAEMSRFWYNTQALLTARTKVLGVGSDLEVAEIN